MKDEFWADCDTVSKKLAKCDTKIAANGWDTKVE